MAKKKDPRPTNFEALILGFAATALSLMKDVEGRLRQVEYALMRNTRAVAALSPKAPLLDWAGRPVPVPARKPWSAARRAAARKPATARTRAAARTTRRAGGK